MDLAKIEGVDPRNLSVSIEPRNLSVYVETHYLSVCVPRNLSVSIEPRNWLRRGEAHSLSAPRGWELRGTCGNFFFFFFTLVTGLRRSLNIMLSDTRIYEPQIRARFVTTRVATHSYVGGGGQQALARQ